MDKDTLKKIEDKENLMVELKVAEREKHLNRIKAFTLGQHNDLQRIGYLASKTIHDISTPLTTLGINLQYLQSKEDDPQIGLALKSLNLIEDMLLNYKVAVKDQISLEEFNVFSTLRDVRNILSPIMIQKKVNVILSGDRDVVLYANRTKFKQIFINIIANGIDAVQEVPVLRKKVLVKVHKVAEGVKITVFDSGCGISEEDVFKVFLPFFTTKSSERSLGLGLFICKEIVEKDFKGTIDVSSSLGNSTLFSIMIPTHGGLAEW